LYKATCWSPDDTASTLPVRDLREGGREGRRGGYVVTPLRPAIAPQKKKICKNTFPLPYSSLLPSLSPHQLTLQTGQVPDACCSATVAFFQWLEPGACVQMNTWREAGKGGKREA